MPFGFSSTYGRGGQDATYTADYGGIGGGGGGGGGSLNAQMRAMSNFDPAALMNVLQENAYTQWLNNASLGQSIKQADRAYAERMAQEERNRMNRDRGYLAQQAGLDRGSAQAAALGPYGTDVASRRPPMRFNNPLGGYGYWTPDINAMTGYQRQAFLPGGNEMKPSTSRMEAEGLRSDANFAGQLGASRSFAGGSPAGTLPSYWAYPGTYPATTTDPRWVTGDWSSRRRD